MLLGIDEAGRGPLAGPLVVAGVILKEKIEGLKDSKKLTEKRRERLFDEIKKKSLYKIVFVDNKRIDKIGISNSLKEAIEEIIESFKEIENLEMLIDGNRNFGIENLKFLIKADSKIDEVSSASILAKVSRDRYMKEIAKRYPNYQFEKHKGYGTKKHIELIKEFGYSDLHRRSYKIKSLI